MSRLGLGLARSSRSAARAAWLSAPARGGGDDADGALDDGDAAASFALALLLTAVDDAARWARPQLEPLVRLLDLPLLEELPDFEPAFLRSGTK